MIKNILIYAIVNTYTVHLLVESKWKLIQPNCNNLTAQSFSFPLKPYNKYHVIRAE